MTSCISVSNGGGRFGRLLPVNRSEQIYMEVQALFLKLFKNNWATMTKQILKLIILPPTHNSPSVQNGCILVWMWPLTAPQPPWGSLVWALGPQLVMLLWKVQFCQWTLWFGPQPHFLGPGWQFEKLAHWFTSCTLSSPPWGGGGGWLSSLVLWTQIILPFLKLLLATGRWQWWEKSKYIFLVSLTHNAS